MKCPYCGHEMGELPVEAIRASMQGPRMLEIFDLIVAAGDAGISLSKIVDHVYKNNKFTDSFNSAKVTMIRLKERIKQYGWIIESSTSVTSVTEQVYRIKRGS